MTKIITFMVFMICYFGTAKADTHPFGLRMGMSLSELSQIVTLSPSENTPNIYQASQMPNGPEYFKGYLFFVTPEHGLCKITAHTGNIEGTHDKIGNPP